MKIKLKKSNKVFSFILIVLCINTANADYASDANAELQQMQTELALKPNDAKLLNNLAELYYKKGKYEQAEPLFLRSLAIFEKALGKDHPNTKQARDNLEALQAAKTK
jgi:Flp pilus assembly protein TadD